MLSLIRRRLAAQLAIGYLIVLLLVTTGILCIVLPPTPAHELRGTVVKTFAVGFLLAVIGILLVSSFMALRITRSLTAMADSARRFAQGELETRFSVTRQDEVAQLGRAFNAMAQRLQGKIRELEASRSQIEGILQSMSEGVIVVGPGGELLLVNEAARQIFRMGEEPGQSGSFAEWVRQPDLQELARQILETGQSQLQEITVYSPSERYLQVHGTSCRCAPEGARGALLVLHDITSLRRLEQIRREFVANVSHELKTPLTAIRGAVEILLDGALADPNRGKSFLESISEEAGRLHRLVEDLLTLAQVESKQTLLRKEPIPIEAFLEEEAARHQPLAKEHQVSLRLEDLPKSQTLFADRNQLVQAVGNLLDNAIKYNQAGGHVTVRALIKDKKCQIHVEDTGIGIPEEDLPRVFERFYRVDKARSRDTGGTGLGLSIVKHVAEAHGGSVQAESQPGHGSRFILILPLV